MTDRSLIEDLSGALGRQVGKNLQDGETVHVALKGAYSEALVVTGRRVMIVKRGFMSGRLFGSDVFQAALGNIASAEVNMGMLTGYLEISTGGMQNTPKSFWANDGRRDPNKAPNCIGITRPQAARFRDACGVVMGGGRGQAPAAEPTEAASVEIARLWSLHKDGAISLAEYESAKTRIVAGR